MQGMPPSLPDSFSQNPAGAEIGLWPIAWGWWLVIFVSLISISSLIWWFIHYRKKRKPLRIAISELQALGHDNENLRSQCNQILKRVFMSYYPVGSVASLHGDTWADFLNKGLSDKNRMVFKPLISHLSASLYHREMSDSEPTLPSITDHEFAQSSIRLVRVQLPPSKKQLDAMQHMVFAGDAES